MGYSYNDFVTKAKDTGMLEKFSQEDLSIAQHSPEYGMSMLGLMQEEQSAKTAEGRLLAQEAAKTLRSNYSIKGQTAAKQAEIAGVGSFSYDREDDIQNLQDKIANQQDFSYDAEQDPVYKALRQTAIRDSKRAMEDTLARASVGTGGVPSSYAVAAAQQAADNYMGQLGDAVPTLYQKALEEHESALNMDLKRLSALEGDRDARRLEYENGVNRLSAELKLLQESEAAGEARMQALNLARNGDYTQLAKLYGLSAEELKLLVEGVTGPYNQTYDTGVDGRPEGIKGHGTLQPTGAKTEYTVADNRGNTGIATSEILQAQDGTYWYWDAVRREYVPTEGVKNGFVTETENTTLFRNTVMSPREFANDRSVGKETSYNDYLLATLKRWHEDERISDNELAWLMNYYRV